jgi:hypothetical protein
MGSLAGSGGENDGKKEAFPAPLRLETLEEREKGQVAER